MQLKESHPNGEQALNGNQGVVLRILAHEGQNSAAGEHTEITLTNIADAVKQGVKEAIANEERLLDYRELAKRIGLGVRATKDLVNCGKITPALRYSNVARFHWPSVLQELKKHPLR